jgi:dihydrodipicolinate synthase/N-acetylneuraminate lyase
MSNDITELRTHLFDTLRGLKDGSMKLETAQAINETAQTIINSAKVEVDHMKVAGGCSGFISSRENGAPQFANGQSQTTKTQNGTKTVTQVPGATITQHKIGG